MRVVICRNDLLAAVQAYDLWTYLAWQDIRLRYRRSKIGPLWITLSMAIFCLALGGVFSQLFKTEIREYLPFLTVGYVFWGMIAGMLGEFPNVFVENAQYIKDIKVNPFTILFRVVTRHLITLAHNFLIIVGVCWYFGIFPGGIGLIVFPGLILVVLNLVAVGVLLSLFGARFRDVAPTTQSLIQVLFFITPITWFPKLLPADSLVVLTNPIAHYLDLVRSPVLGQVPATASWGVALFTLGIFAWASIVVYKAKAARIPFWV